MLRPIRRLLNAMTRRGAIRGYLRALPRQLYKDYGHTGPFTPMQVEASIRRRGGLSRGHAIYAMAIFCDRTALANQLRGEPASGGVRDLRTALGGDYLGPGADFAFADVTRYLAQHGFQPTGGGESHGHHGYDGWVDHGGDGGHGHVGDGGGDGGGH